MERDEWLKRYKQRMIDHGVTEEEAEIARNAADDDSFFAFFDDDPETAADDELSYWASDG
jgi:hypothetical protein